MSQTPERYARATNSSHLRVQLQPGDIDAIIAAGWVKVGLSTHLARLMVEIDTVDQRLFVGHGVEVSRVDWTMMRSRLPNLAPTVRELTKYAHRLARERYPEVDVGQVLPIMHGVLAQLLLPVCPACHGRMFQVIPDTPNLSHKACRACNGTGVRRLRTPGGRRGEEFAAALEAGVSSKMQVLFEVMARHLRNQLDLPIGTERGNARIAEHCTQVLHENPNDGAARKVLARTQERTS
jgi:hypothetical protein